MTAGVRNENTITASEPRKPASEPRKPVPDSIRAPKVSPDTNVACRLTCNKVGLCPRPNITTVFHPESYVTLLTIIPHRIPAFWHGILAYLTPSPTRYRHFFSRSRMFTSQSVSGVLSAGQGYSFQHEMRLEGPARRLPRLSRN